MKDGWECTFRLQLRAIRDSFANYYVCPAYDVSFFFSLTLSFPLSLLCLPLSLVFPLRLSFYFTLIFVYFPNFRRFRRKIARLSISRLPFMFRVPARVIGMSRARRRVSVTDIGRDDGKWVTSIHIRSVCNLLIAHVLNKNDLLD